TRTVPAQAAACLAVWALLGFPVRLESSMATIVASLPFMLVYPLALSTVTYALGHRVALQNRHLERLNRIDVLTGLPNRRHWDEVADSELARYQRSRRPAVVLPVDVDNFKEVSDAHGPGTGDHGLRWGGRHWDEVADSELARYLRSRRPAVVMLIDVDNFKEVNDAHAHGTGDDVLRCGARVLRASVREIDTPARYGGDEFAVLLAESDVRG